MEIWLSTLDDAGRKSAIPLVLAPGQRLEANVPGGVRVVGLLFSDETSQSELVLTLTQKPEG